MHQIQEEIGIPKFKPQKKGDNHMVFTLGPLPPGYGMTVGNALRRVLLSSLPGAAITGVKIQGVTHEYSTIKGIKDSILDINLNIKQLYVQMENKEPAKLELNVSKPGVITAKDIKCPTGVKILNPDQYITTIDGKKTKLKMELRAEKGVGYVPASQRIKEEKVADMIVLDAVYTPVIKVRYDVENTRVGQMTNLDKLVLEIKTDGTIVPEDALKFSSNILVSYFNLFNEEGVMVEQDFMSDFAKIAAKEQEQEKTKPVQESYTPIEILGFSPRTLNALINGGIGSIEQLSKCTESKLSNLRGFGKKALSEVQEALDKKGLTLAEE
ncbi:DNA-directed RNA polymerase subunit alpha [Candidatus Peregrinibacteria bacterium]|nr:DNA-directed RNA polymerase subunit alpha [Candidatus Peregrinibacteria bacterium]